MKPIKYREAEKIVKNNGYALDRISGDHAIYKKPGKSLSLPKKSEISAGVWRNLLKLMAVVTILWIINAHLTI